MPMTNQTSKTADTSSSLRGFATLADCELVAAILDDRTIGDPCSGFSAFIGTTKKRKLQGIDSERLTAAGLAPNVYLAIRWWCLLFIPVVPLKAYAVADYNSIDRPFSDPHSRAFPVSMDWRIAFIQAAVGLGAVAITLTIGLWVSSL